MHLQLLVNLSEISSQSGEPPPSGKQCSVQGSLLEEGPAGSDGQWSAWSHSDPSADNRSPCNNTHRESPNPTRRPHPPDLPSRNSSFAIKTP